MMKIINYIKKKLFEPQETVIASNTLSSEEMKKIIGEETSNLSNEEILKRFNELPVEKQVMAFFGQKSGNEK